MLLKGSLLVFAGHAFRLGAGMAVFVALARQLGPAGFGQFVFYFAVATLLAMPVNFGFGALVLRGFGVAPAHALQMMGRVYAAKLALSLGVVGFATACLPWVPADARLVLALLLAAQLFDSFAEFHSLGFRLKSHFSRETSTSSIVSAWHVLVMLVSVWLWPTVEAAACAFAISRATGMWFTRRRSRASVGRVKRETAGTVWHTLKQSWAYALELGLSTAYGQLDSLLINHVLGPAAVGLYQAGMRLVDGAARIAPVLAHVWLPELSRSNADGQEFREEFRRMAARTCFAFAGVGGAGCLILWLGASPITHTLFGAPYKGLEPLLPMFGLILFLRFAETGLGMLLVARDLQSRKVWFVALQVAVMASFGGYGLNEHGLPGWQWLSAGTLLGLLACYGWSMARRGRGAPQ